MTMPMLTPVPVSDPSRRTLSAQHRDSLSAMLTDVLAALYADLDQLCAGIAQAQNRILDELLPEQEAATPPAGLLARANSGAAPMAQSCP